MIMISITKILTSFILYTCFFATSNAIFESNLPDEAFFDFAQLADQYGVPCEDFDVITEDGYILKLFHIKGNKSRPVLFFHGIFDSSDTFLLRGDNSSGVSLAKEGYDLWFGNVRGNKYSRRHVSLNPDKDKEFWDFSFHEFGYYDLPACIDFVLNKTSQRKLSGIAHSQGTTMFYVLGSTRPEYNAKVRVIISLAPIAYLTHLKPLAGALAPIWPVASAALAQMGINELFRSGSDANQLIQYLCSLQPEGNELCEQDIAMTISGNDTEEISPEFFDIIIGHFPAGTSRKDVDHQAQVVLRKKFACFDYGTVGNLLEYGIVKPPQYNLTAVTMNVALLCGKNDHLSVLADVEKLRKELPNVVLYKVMDRKEFNHIDFIWGKHIDVYLNPLLKSLLQKYSV